MDVDAKRGKKQKHKIALKSIRTRHEKQQAMQCITPTTGELATVNLLTALIQIVPNNCQRKKREEGGRGRKWPGKMLVNGWIMWFISYLIIILLNDLAYIHSRYAGKYVHTLSYIYTLCISYTSNVWPIIETIDVRCGSSTFAAIPAA